MDEGTVGLIIFAVLLIGSAIVAHRLISHFWLASLLAALEAAVLLQIVAYVYSGSLDPFIAVAFVVSLVVGFVGALLIGFLMHRLGYAA